VYTLEEVYHISSYNYDYIICSILTESQDQGLFNKPGYMLSPILFLEISLKQSKSTKHLIGFLRHCKYSTGSKGSIGLLIVMKVKHNVSKT